MKWKSEENIRKLMNENKDNVNLLIECGYLSKDISKMFLMLVRYIITGDINWKESFGENWKVVHVFIFSGDPEYYTIFIQVSKSKPWIPLFGYLALINC